MLLSVLELFISLTSSEYFVSIICSIYNTVSVLLVNISPPYINAFEVIPQDDMFLFIQTSQTAAALLSWHFQGISYYSDVFIGAYCLILYY